MIPDCDHDRLVQRFWDATHHEGESMDDAPGWEKHQCYVNVAAVLTELGTMGYVIAKLEGKVS